jgi:hypothetical protein
VGCEGRDGLPESQCRRRQDSEGRRCPSRAGAGGR